jgi:predicted RNA-binding protein with PUA-like domain
VSAARRASAARPAASGRSAAAPAGPARFWLVKSEPSEYSIADLQRDGVTGWDGVRNWQARNTLRDAMRPGDGVLFYHSGEEPLAVVGTCRVAGPPRPDETQFRRGHPHFDPDSPRGEPRWWLVDLRHEETFSVPVERARLAAEPALRGMALLARGSRLSVQPVTPAEWAAVLALAHGPARGGRPHSA